MRCGADRLKTFAEHGRYHVSLVICRSASLNQSCPFALSRRRAKRLRIIDRDYGTLNKILTRPLELCNSALTRESNRMLPIVCAIVRPVKNLLQTSASITARSVSSRQPSVTTILTETSWIVVQPSTRAPAKVLRCDGWAKLAWRPDAGSKEADLNS